MRAKAVYEFVKKELASLYVVLRDLYFQWRNYKQTIAKLEMRVHELEQQLSKQQTTHSKSDTRQINEGTPGYEAIHEYVGVVGVTFNNDDGTNRQDILKKCKRRMPVELRRTPMKKYPNAIGVFTRFGQIGNISEDDNEDIAQSMDAGMPIEHAQIASLTGGTKDKPTIGCAISFTYYSKE